MSTLRAFTFPIQLAQVVIERYGLVVPTPPGCLTVEVRVHRAAGTMFAASMLTRISDTTLSFIYLTEEAGTR